MRTAVHVTRTLFVWLFSLLVALVSFRYLVPSVKVDPGPLLDHALNRPLAFYAHVILAPVALAVMPAQFWGGLRNRLPGLHRWLGRVYGLAILGAGSAGLVLALQTQSSLAAGTGFALLAAAWLGTTGRGILLAMQGQVARHRPWMLRSAALTFAAVTLRLQMTVAEIWGVPHEPAYAAIAWLSWVPNLLVAEWLIRRAAARPRAARPVRRTVARA
jgi:hypothetical protein